MSHTASPTVGAARSEALLARLRARRKLPPAIERKRIRRAAGASLRDVAAAIGVSHTAVVRWEKGADPGPHTRAYAELLDELKSLTA